MSLLDLDVEADAGPELGVEGCGLEAPSIAASQALVARLIGSPDDDVVGVAELELDGDAAARLVLRGSGGSRGVCFAARPLFYARTSASASEAA